MLVPTSRERADGGDGEVASLVMRGLYRGLGCLTSRHAADIVNGLAEFGFLAVAPPARRRRLLVVIWLFLIDRPWLV